jgi:hypothetical protein
MPTTKERQLAEFYGTMLAPSTKAISRRAWGIDVETFWVPVFTAAKVMGQALDLPDESLGAPIRLAHDKDGAVKFSQSGKPTFRVDSRLNEYVNRARENYIAVNLAYVGEVAQERSKTYKAQVERQQLAGQPLIDADDAALDEAVQLMHEAAEAALAEMATPSDNHHEPVEPVTA